MLLAEHTVISPPLRMLPSVAVGADSLTAHMLLLRPSEELSQRCLQCLCEAAVDCFNVPIQAEMGPSSLQLNIHIHCVEGCVCTSHRR